jgi:hypothetical protein
VADTDCTGYVGGENKGALQKGAVLRLEFNHLGEYIFEAVGTNTADVDMMLRG